MFENKRILICPLNWGIGHATRMVAYAKQLESVGNTISVMGANEVLEVFKEEMPRVQRIPFLDIKVRYAHSDKIVRKIVLHTPAYLISAFREHWALNRLLRDYDFDVIISDNRPALWSKKVKSYYITHQLSIKLSEGWQWAEALANRIHLWFIKHYDACLIPDVEGKEALSGELSKIQHSDVKVKYIGWLSRFTKPEVLPEKENYALLILSGVEPHRSFLREEVVKRYRKSGEHLIIAGDDKASTVENIISLPYVRTEALKPLILSADHIICRSGYSMLMDLKVLGCEAELIPTPGQPEQEYLAKLHAKA